METRKEIKILVDKILEKLKIKKIILFGSYAYGNPNDESDIDLCIIINENRRKLEIIREIRRIVFQRKFTTPDIRVRFMFLHLLELLKTEEDYQLTANINRLFDVSKKMGDVYTRKLFVLYDMHKYLAIYQANTKLKEML